MDRETLSSSDINRLGPPFILFCIAAVVAALSLDFIFATFRILLDPAFLRGFGFMILQVVVVSAVGGVIGLGLAEAVLRSEWTTQSTIRFLHLGMWLPFFCAWGTPTWFIPAVTFAACYWYLSARHTLQLERLPAVLVTLRPLLLHSLFLALLAQFFVRTNGWEWWGGPYLDASRMTAAILLLGGLLFIFVLIFNAETGEKTAILTLRQIHASNLRSLFGATMLWLLCFIIWDTYFVFLRDFLAVASLRDVIRAAYRLLTTGPMVSNTTDTLWLDIAVSVQEIGIGLLLGGALSFLLVRVIQTGESKSRLSCLLIFTHTLPIVIAIASTPWIGINKWLRAVIVAAASLFPFAENLWRFRTLPPITRILLSLEKALPYAFVGMLMGESWAATAGLGFLIVVFGAKGNITESLATALITLALMLSVSVVLRHVIKRLVHSEGDLDVQ